MSLKAKFPPSLTLSMFFAKKMLGFCEVDVQDRSNERRKYRIHFRYIHEELQGDGTPLARQPWWKTGDNRDPLYDLFTDESSMCGILRNYYPIVADDNLIKNFLWRDVSSLCSTQIFNQFNLYVEK